MIFFNEIKLSMRIFDKKMLFLDKMNAETKLQIQILSKQIRHRTPLYRM